MQTDAMIRCEPSVWVVYGLRAVPELPAPRLLHAVPTGLAAGSGLNTQDPAREVGGT